MAYSEIPLEEKGARNSKADLSLIQGMHDHAVSLGAQCGMEESAKQDSVNLVESAATTDPIVLREARADYEIKLIAPGKGSSAFYPAEVLKRDGPQVFTSGTHVYLNHPTAAEEAARPEGSVLNLAGVLTSAARYEENHAKGPGLYARMKVFADHAAIVEEKAPHVGMSIRASGIAESSKQQDGLPVLKQLTSAASVDVVTRAGAGGMILTESARPADTTPKESKGMDAETKQLVESSVKEAVAAALREAQSTQAAPPVIPDWALRGEAREVATGLLESLSLHKETKASVLEHVLTGALPAKGSGLDREAFSTRVTEASKAFGALEAKLTGAGQVRGMGTAPVQESAEQKTAREATEKQIREAAVDSFNRIMGSKTAAEHAAKGRAN